MEAKNDFYWLKIERPRLGQGFEQHPVENGPCGTEQGCRSSSSGSMGVTTNPKSEKRQVQGITEDSTGPESRASLTCLERNESIS